MKQMKRLLISTAIIVVALLGAGAIATPAYAATGVLDQACNQAGGVGSSSGACGTDGTDPISGNNGVLIRISRIMAIIAGIAAVIIIMIAGLVYITANGDAGRISAAKSTIIYAAVGLVIIALAQAIITLFVSRVA